MDRTRDELIARYRHLRAIGVQHHDKVMTGFLSVSAILEHARNIGLAAGRTLVVDDMDHLSLAYDLAIYTAPSGRSRAIDRYANAAKLGTESDEGKVLAAKCRVQFSIWQFERRHEAAGVIVRDLLRGRDTWLVDEGLELTGEPGMTFASRLYSPENFAMGCGVMVPVDRMILEEALAAVPPRLRGNPADVAEDRRFAAAVYRSALAAGVMDRVALAAPGEAEAVRSGRSRA